MCVAPNPGDSSCEGMPYTVDRVPCRAARYLLSHTQFLDPFADMQYLATQMPYQLRRDRRKPLPCRMESPNSLRDLGTTYRSRLLNPLDVQARGTPSRARPPSCPPWVRVRIPG